MTSVLEELREVVIQGKPDEAAELVQKAIDDQTDPGSIVDDALIPAMTVTGDRFEVGEFCLPEMMLSARAMQASMDLLQPLLAETGRKPVGIVVIGTVKGDLHDIGKNLVATLLKGAGFEIVDLGANVPPERFVQAVKEQRADMVGMSALLTTTLPMMEETIKALIEAGVRDQVRVLIGGAPATNGYAEQIGADGYAPDASAATKTARELLGIV
jgi:5-methyltetrahydrofolate--homocysteine methyltransferase